MTDDPGPSSAPEAGAATPQPPPAGASKADAPLSLFARAHLAVWIGAALFLILAVVIATHWPDFALTPPQQQQRAAETTASPTPPAAAAPAPAPAVSANPESLADLAARLSGIETRLGTIENALSRTADKDVQASLQDRLARLESQSSGEALRRTGSVVALAMLARAASEAENFKPELDAMAALEPSDPAIAQLTPYADAGVPTLPMLRARFPGAARDALEAERVAGEGNSVMSRLWSSVTGLVQVRPVGNPTGGTSADILARAETDLMRGGLMAAISETRALKGEAASHMASWLKDAQARAAVDAAIAAMDARIVQALAAARPQEQR
jgi:hypothetical protein